MPCAEPVGNREGPSLRQCNALLNNRQAMGQVRIVNKTCLVRHDQHVLFQERLKSIKKTHGGKEVGKVTVDMVIGGMRGITVSPAHIDFRLHQA